MLLAEIRHLLFLLGELLFDLRNLIGDKGRCRHRLIVALLQILIKET